ncbi:MAG: hydrogenase formation protein HypD [Anaerolineales bacterium]|nr:hydrogenase formation protein HypD [Anaerolineales bacterium]
MRYIDEFRDPRLCLDRIDRIHARMSALDRRVKIMEICGGHTHSIYRYGLPGLLPYGIEFVHGPGCPVCVVPMGRIDDVRHLAEVEGVTLCAFGDVVRVPGRNGSLLEAKARGADVRVVYSPMDALAIAKREPGRTVVFLGLGFETTTPPTAATLLRARDEGLENFAVHCNHVLVNPAIRAILEAPGQDIDAFIGPGHVSSIIGTRGYEFVARDWAKPLVVSGFEPLDLLTALEMLLDQLIAGRAEVENQYTRVVTESGNPKAQDLTSAVFAVRPHFEWRGLGSIPHSALAIRPELAAWDAEARFEMPGVKLEDARACQCGDILKGVKKPWECRVFATACTPEHPIGTCMVSAEGACAAYYSYGRHAVDTRTEAM